MKNKEKFAKEIVELACNESDIVVSKTTGNPIDCSIIECKSAVTLPVCEE